MKRLAAGCWLAVIGVGCAGPSNQQEGRTTPLKTSEFLQRIVGAWNYEGEAMAGPDQPPAKIQGTERGRMVGAWAVLEGNSSTPGGEFTSVLTLGYDTERKTCVGLWIDSTSDTLWQYEATLDASGKVLTLETEGPNPTVPGKLFRYRNVIETLGADRKVLRSMIEMDGKWITYLTSQYRRTR